MAAKLDANKRKQKFTKNKIGEKNEDDKKFKKK